MRKIIFLGCALLLAAPALPAQTVYRWVDQDGVVHYSDQPHPGADTVTLEPAPAPGTRVPVRAAAAAPAAGNDRSGNRSEPRVNYESLSISSPAAEETLWNIGSVLNVSLDLQPALQPGHRVRVYFDGERREVSGLQFQIEEVYRGAHNLQAEVVDSNGQVRIRSEPSRFYVQQTSVINRPAN